MTLIGQVSDLHVAAPGSKTSGDVDTAHYLGALLGHLAGLSPALDALVITGDLAQNGERDAYLAVRSMLEGLPFPVFAVPGNHDDRGVFTDLLRPFCPPGLERAPRPFVCGELAVGGVGLILVDTVVEGAHWGGIAPETARWLSRALSSYETPSLVFAHHPPFPSGLELMDEPFRDSMALADILCQNRRAVFCCGHLHRSLCTDFGGVRGVVCPSLALNMELDFGPGGGNSFTVAAPAYALHRLEGGTITSHFCQVPGSWPYLGPFEF